MRIVKSKEFLIGAVVGFFVVPYLSRAVTPLISKVKGDA